MKPLSFPALIFLVGALNLQGAVVLNEPFAYPDGPLIGQGSWIITGTSVVNPLQVAGGRVNLTTTGQDANSALTATINNIDGTSFYYGATLNFASSQTGDYFLHTTPHPTNTSAFFSRLFAAASGGGFVLGYQENSGTGTQTNLGSTILSFNTPYRVVVAYNFVAGATNDTAAVYVNPLFPVEGANTPYLTDSWTTVSAEPTVIGTINLRQGTASVGSTLSIDDLVVATAFSDIVPIPEPGTSALLALGPLIFLARRFASRR